MLSKNLLRLVISGCLALAVRGTELPGVNAALQAAIERKEIAGAVAVVVTPDAVRHVGAVGFADLEARRAMTTDTLFWIASMTKPITGMAILLLRDEGKVDVDADVSKYLPELGALQLASGERVSVKVRQLLLHTSGLRDAPLKGVRTLQEAIAVYATLSVEFVPGSRWKYSQAGYNVAARIVEVVSGEPFDQFVQHRIFDPLGMRHSTFRRDGAWATALATAYGKDAKTAALVPVPPHLDYGMPDCAPFGNGGIYSTGPDYARFCQMLLDRGVIDGKRMLSQESFALLTTVQTGDLPTGFFQREPPGSLGANYGWGLGCGVLKVPHPRATAVLSAGSFGHGGAWGTQAWMDPVRGVGYILMIQRSALRNADDSEVRSAFQEAAYRAFATPTSAVYDARINGREILTPPAPAMPRLTGPTIHGARPGKPLHFRISATGEKPLTYGAAGLPPGVTIDLDTGWITGRVPDRSGDVTITVTAANARGRAERTLTLRVGDTICLTPPLGWNSWYVHSEGVSDRAIREIAQAMADHGLPDHGWTYVNIDDCWAGLRDPVTKAIQPNSKFGDMKALAGFVNARGLKLGLYSTAWMSTYAGHIGGTAPNEAGDYSAFFLPLEQRQHPEQPFGRYPGGIRKGLATIGPVWFVDRDARQFAAWGIEYVKYDWVEQVLKLTEQGYFPDKTKPMRKTEPVLRHVYEDLRAVDRDIVISASPRHDEVEDTFVPQYCNLWRLTSDIDARWPRLIAPFEMGARLALTRPGHYGDLDMLQIGPLGVPNRAEKVFKPSPLTPDEQYFQVTLWCLFTQPLLLSCHVPTMDAFDLNLVTNDEVLAIDQDPLCRPARRVAQAAGEWEIWAKDLADGGKAVALFNLSSTDRVLSLESASLGLAGGRVRDLWRQKDIGTLDALLAANIGPHGVLFVRVTR